VDAGSASLLVVRQQNGRQAQQLRDDSVRQFGLISKNKEFSQQLALGFITVVEPSFDQ
jgi:hypothetical protein